MSGELEKALSKILKDQETGQMEVGDDNIWIEVIQGVEEAYAQSVVYQTELEKTTAELDEAYQFISNILASMTDVVIVVDKESKIRRVNLSFEQMTGYAEKEVIDKPLYYFLEPKKDARGNPTKAFFDATEKAHNLGSHIQASPEGLQVTLNGKYNQVDLSISYSRSNTDKPKGFDVDVIVGRPVDGLLQAFNRLKEQNETLNAAHKQIVNTEKMAALGRLVAGVAHELNTPVSVIKGNIWTLNQYMEERTSYMRALEALVPQGELEALRQETEISEVETDLPLLIKGNQEAVEHVGNIISDLRLFNQKKARNSAVNFAEVVKRSLNWVIKNTTRNIDLKTDLDNNVIVYVDEGRLQQVCINLFQNALDVIKELEHPQIKTCLTQQGDMIVFRVQDNGAGIAENEVEKIFEPFFTTKSLGSGLGLGLSITHSLLQEMGGEISAWNDIEGGAIFEVRLTKRPTQ